jgi:hypothetical protein
VQLICQSQNFLLPWVLGYTGDSINTAESKPATSNVTRIESMVSKSLKKNKCIIILLADKGNCRAETSEFTYKKTVFCLLKPGVCYKPSHKDPTRQTDNIGNFLTINLWFPLFRNINRHTITVNHLPLWTSNGTKTRHPLRPIVSSTGSPAMLLRNFFVTFWGLTWQFVKNSQHFIQSINEINLQSGTSLVTFNAVSV